MATIHCHVQVEQALEDLGLRQGSTPCSGGLPITGCGCEGGNVGDGTGEVFRDKAGDTLYYRTLKAASPNVTIVTVGDTVTIDAAGGLVGPDPSTLRAIATYANTNGTALYDNDIRIDTSPDSPGSFDHLAIQGYVDLAPGVWVDMIQLGAVSGNGTPGGPAVRVGTEDALLDFFALWDPTMVGPAGGGKVIYESINESWMIRKEGGINIPSPNTTRVFYLGTTSTNGARADYYVGAIDPTGVVSADPGSMYTEVNGSSSKVWQHRGTGFDNTSWVELGALGAIQATDVGVYVIIGGGTPIDNVQDTINMFGMAGTAQHNSPHITDAGSGTIDVSSGWGALRTFDDPDQDLYLISWAPVSGSSIPTDTVRYVGVEYNAGSPQVTVRSSDNFNGHTDFHLGSVVNEGGTLHILNNPQYCSDFGERIYHRFFETMPLQRADRLGGIIPAGTGTRYLIVSAGELYDGFNEFSISAIDTSGSDTFDSYYRDGVGGFTKVASQSQWDNTQYDDGSGTLATLSTGRWAVHWLYIEADGNLVLLYGQGQYTSAAGAEGETAPATVPQRILSHGRLLGRLVFQKSATSPDSVVNVWDDVFAGTASGGDVFGPASATDNAIARFDSSTGKLIDDSLMLINDDGNFSTLSGDSVSPMGMETEGTNGAECRSYVGNRDPIGNVSAPPGSIYARVDGVTSRVYQHRGSTGNNTDWVDLSGLGNAGEGGISTFNTATSGDPGDKKFLLNNATQASATAINIDDNAENGLDYSSLLLKLKNGDAIQVQQGDDKTRYHLFNVTGNPTDNTTYVTLPISSASAGADLQSGKKCNLIFHFSSDTGGGSGQTANIGFYAYRTTSNQTLSSGVETTVGMNSKRDDTGSDFTTGTSDSYFTCPSDGRYVFCASVELTLAAAGRGETRIYSSTHGRVAESSDHENTSGTVKPSISAALYCDEDEVIRLKAWQNSGYTATIELAYSHFSGAQIVDVS